MPQVAHAVLLRHIDRAFFQQFLVMVRKCCHVPCSVRLPSAMNHYGQGFDRVELGGGRMLDLPAAGHVVPDMALVTYWGLKVYDYFQVVSAVDHVTFAPHSLETLDSSHMPWEKMPSHVPSDTDHAPCGRDFDLVQGERNSGLGSDSVFD